MTEKARILVVDDEHSVRWAFEKALQKAGYHVALAENGVKGLKLYKEFKPEVVLVDMRMPEMDGLQLLKHIREIDSEAQVIVMTAYADMETTITAMKLGAYDFLSKPFNIDECLLLISRGLSTKKLEGKVEIATQAPKSCGLKGNSLAMQEVYKLIGKVSEEEITVLITGESGSGKELVAQAIHYNSDRALKTFWAINCTAINESLMESELFGYEKGAFTGAVASKPGMFELAQGGTIFLDEIGDMSMEMQAKLLRVLEEREIVRVGGNKQIRVDVRIIAATNKNLRKIIANGRFREDLYHRIKVIEIKLPSLRERPEDISLLAKYFCSIIATNRKGAPKMLSEETIAILSAYDWPGNVRELKNAIEQSYTLSRNHIMLPEHLPIEVRDGKSEMILEKKMETTASGTSITNNSAELVDTAEYNHESTGVHSRKTNDRQITNENCSITGILKQLIKKSPTTQVYSFVMQPTAKELLRQSLEYNKGNQVQSASHLGITRNTLRAKIEKYEL